MNKFLKEFKDRGFFYQCTSEDELSKQLDEEKIKGYIGFDCTAESLHVGSLLQIMCLRLLQKNGHRPIVLLGGGTTRIGDPSGKDKTRKILSEDEIEKNIKNIKNILKKFLDNDDPNTKPIFVNNYTWLKDLNYISFLRDIGKHFTINRMLTFDSVKLRLDREQSLSYMEFNYMILQAYDFLELNKKENSKIMIDNFFRLSRSTYAEGLGALYAYERQVPEIADTKIKGLVDHYDVSSDKGLEYFVVHKDADVEHREQIK